jgi:hypothetical protein
MEATYLFTSGGVTVEGTITFAGPHYVWTVCEICGESFTKCAAFDAMCAAWKQHDDSI